MPRSKTPTCTPLAHRRTPGHVSLPKLEGLQVTAITPRAFTDDKLVFRHAAGASRVSCWRSAGTPLVDTRCSARAPHCSYHRERIRRAIGRGNAWPVVISPRFLLTGSPLSSRPVSTSTPLTGCCGTRPTRAGSLASWVITRSGRSLKHRHPGRLRGCGRGEHRGHRRPSPRPPAGLRQRGHARSVAGNNRPAAAERPDTRLHALPVVRRPGRHHPRLRTHPAIRPRSMTVTARTSGWRCRSPRREGCRTPQPPTGTGCRECG